MARVDIQPMKEIVYPDRGGYTGYAICAWETDYKDPDSFVLLAYWGHVSEGYETLQKSKYVLEARFFVFGSWLKRIFISENSSGNVARFSKELSNKWKPIMDEIIEKEKKLWQEKGRTHMHIDEVVDDRLRSSL